MPGKAFAVGTAAAMLVMLIAATGAGAATVSRETIGTVGTIGETAVVVSDSSLLDAANPVETNAMTIGWDADMQEIIIRDTGAPLTVSYGDCRLVSTAEVRCAKPSMAVEVRPGRGSDKVAFLPGLPALGRAGAYPWIVRNLNGAMEDNTAVDHYSGGSERNWFSGGDGADVLDGGGGDDMLDTTAEVGDLRGGEGNDILAALSNTLTGSTLLDGDAGHDTITGYGRLLGGTGSDTLRPERGAGDVIDGGPGRDEVSYHFHDRPVTIDLDGGPSFAQGMKGEGDSITDVEDVVASQFGDTVYGTDSSNWISGLAGSDELHGRGGDDNMNGGTSTTSASDGPDVVDGGPGRDSASYDARDVGVTVDLRRTDNQGEAGENDTLTSIEEASDGQGDDLLIGSAGTDFFRIHGGTDRIELRDGVADTVWCGGNSGPEDVVIADALDDVGSCATVDRSPPPPASDSDHDGVADTADRCPTVAGPASTAGCPLGTAPPGVVNPGPPPDVVNPGPPTSALAAPRAASTKLRANSRRRIAVRLAAAPATETVAVTLKRGNRTLASGKVMATKGAPAVVPVRLGARIYRRLRRAGRMSASLTLRAGARTRTLSVTLRARGA